MKFNFKDLMVFVLTFFLFFSSAYLPIFSQDAVKTWDIQNTKIPPIKAHPLSMRWFFEHDQFHVVSISDGKIIVGSLSGDSYNEEQSLSVADCSYTTVQVEDITGDAQPEIIAGTDEPGFIHIYSRDAENKWITNSSAKYIWSSVANLFVGSFSSTAEKEVIVQDTEGFLYLFKNTAQTLNLVWKSPSSWRIIDDYLVTDFDHDLYAEIVATYKTGGIAVLKVQNNTVVSPWENYPWGKILAMTYGDWNTDGQSELLLTTSRKIVYSLTLSDKGYNLNQETWQFNYLVENLHTVRSDFPEMIVIDTSGQLHLLEYQAELKQFVEKQVFRTGRIAQIIPNPKASQYLLLGMKSNILFLNSTNNF